MMKDFNIESEKYYLYAFTFIQDQLKNEKDIKFNVKLEEGKIVFELCIDKDTQKYILNSMIKEIEKLTGGK